MPRIDLDAIQQTNATGYPPPFDGPVQQRWYRRIAPETGIEDFGVSHVVLKPGAQSSQRHWHENEDELVVMLSGRAVLIDDAGETAMIAGDIAVFLKGDGSGHMLRNDGDDDCAFVAIGKAADSACHYPDVDMHLPAGPGVRAFTRKDGTPYPADMGG